MRKFYALLIALFVTLAVSAQTVIDIKAIDAALTTTIDGELVIDIAKTSSKKETPLLSYDNPFKGKTFTDAEISFDVYNYGEIKVLGSLFAMYDAVLGRMYFTNGSYLGYNATGGWFDANLVNYAVGIDFIGANTWKKIKLQFTATGFAMYVDSKLAFDQKSTDITIATDPAAPLADYSNVLSFFQNASTFMVGAGSWWSDNTKDDGSFWDPQNSYLKNIKFTPNFSKTNAVKQLNIDSNSKLVGEEYFSISGAKVGSDFNTLKSGLYIKKAVYSNGAIKSTKIVKAQ